ncbi:hypothetical protein HEP86_39315 [Streptomyces sp. RPA4-5]|uniref:hypothetical protein n=1 Tax=Streptomyces TaxID=1883 RepID=UPI00143E7D17|nr:MULTISPECIES: hypothetical protein [Streptomyces]MCX4639079.1 hypothetical protein [Streptomyces platensis]QIY59396.1 hypothetical protein HEP86_39315 [Streptomyces sp. RPA4-5]
MLLTALTCGSAVAEQRPADAWINVSGIGACHDGYICLYENYQANQNAVGLGTTLVGRESTETARSDSAEPPPCASRVR